MLLRPLLPDHRSLACQEVRLIGDSVVIFVSSTLPTSRCPQCCQSSGRVHSRYERELADLPWQGLPVHVRWRSRKFFCDNPFCAQRIFTERLPAVAESYGRKTCRMATVLFAIGFACGGEGGTRLVERLGMSASPDSLLRAIRRGTLPEAKTPRVLGVDDWAFRRGKRYGTILCDLERHRPVDLLPERSSEALANWLKAHPGVEIVSRDRGDYYIKGATAGAPNAVQVADRWHLLKNLREALVRVVDRHCQQVHAAARVAAATVETDSPESPDEGMPSEDSVTPASLTRAEQLKQERRARRVKRYRRVVKLHAQRVPIREIARQLGMHRGTVRRFLVAGSFPERAQRKYRRQTDPFVDYLRKRWDEGCHNAVQLIKELRQQGFEGSYDMVRRRVARWRRRSRGVIKTRSAKRSSSAVERPSSNRVAWLLLKPPAEPLPEEQALLKSLAEQCPSLEKAAALAREFAEMVRQRKVHSLDDWIERVSASDGIVELGRFAEGLRDDLAAVRAALSLPWSNGQTEGHVNRLKLIKRQMFGRANFDLLRQRVLHTCWAA
jgi:transposase